MPEEKKPRAMSRHSLNIDRREHVAVTGVSDVISFDEESVIGETEMGTLIIRGSNLHVNRINLEGGELSITGEIDGITYEDPNSSARGKTLFNRLFK
jgi:sporulation protein YabP